MSERSRIAAWLGPVALAAVFAAAVLLLHRAPVGLPAEPAPILVAERIEAGAPVASLALPHDWKSADWKSEPTLGRVHYRLRFALLAKPDAAWSLYLPSASPFSELRLGGEPLQFGPRAATRSLDLAYLMVPRLVSLSPTALRAGENAIDLVMETRPGAGYLGPVYVGPTSALERSYAARRFLHVTLVRVVFVAVLGFAIFLGASWALRPSDPVPGWLGAIFAVCALGMWNLATFDLPLPHPANTFVGNGWVLALLVGFTHRLLGMRRPRLEWGFLAFALFASATRFLAPAGPAWEALRPPLFLVTLLAGVYPFGLILRAFARGTAPGIAWVVGAGLVFAIGAGHDLAVAAGAIPRGPGLVLVWSLGLSVLLLGWAYVRRFASALETSEALTQHLEQRVAEKEAELASNYQRLAELERAQAISAERTRLMEELHDGTGGQIASALAMLRSGRSSREDVVSGLRRALQDMRLIVHSLDDETGDLATLLGLLRDQLEPALDAAGIALEWEVCDTPEPRGYGPEMALHVLRIVQEAVVNAIEHARPERVRIRTAVDGEPESRAVLVSVEDDGVGFASEASQGPTPAPRAGRGRGLANMRRRAQRMGGELRVDALSPGPGTRIALRLAVG